MPNVFIYQTDIYEHRLNESALGARNESVHESHMAFSLATRQMLNRC